MNDAKVLVDTNIVIYVFQGNMKAVSLIEDTELVVSVLTTMELFAVPAITQDRTVWVSGFLQHCQEVPLLRAVQRKAVEVRRLTKLEMVDSIIAATAIVKALPLITADRTFTKIDHLVDLRLFQP